MLRFCDVDVDRLAECLGRYGLTIEQVGADDSIPASFWGETEAGIRGTTVFVRQDTPVHSVLHEACHIVCMSGARRKALDRDAGGDDLEECAVCYLQILLADAILGVGSARLMRDMDAWGYSFRLGSTADWFERDADDALGWLIRRGLVTAAGQPVYRLRQ